jgi:hypothetical protein
VFCIAMFPPSTTVSPCVFHCHVSNPSLQLFLCVLYCHVSTLHCSYLCVLYCRVYILHCSCPFVFCIVMFPFFTAVAPLCFVLSCFHPSLQLPLCVVWCHV